MRFENNNNNNHNKLPFAHVKMVVIAHSHASPNYKTKVMNSDLDPAT